MFRLMLLLFALSICLVASVSLKLRKLVSHTRMKRAYMPRSLGLELDETVLTVLPLHYSRELKMAPVILMDVTHSLFMYRRRAINDIQYRGKLGSYIDDVAEVLADFADRISMITNFDERPALDKSLKLMKSRIRDRATFLTLKEREKAMLAVLAHSAEIDNFLDNACRAIVDEFDSRGGTEKELVIALEAFTGWHFEDMHYADQLESDAYLLMARAVMSHAQTHSYDSMITQFNAIANLCKFRLAHNGPKLVSYCLGNDLSSKLAKRAENLIAKEDDYMLDTAYDYYYMTLDEMESLRSPLYDKKKQRNMLSTLVKYWDEKPSIKNAKKYLKSAEEHHSLDEHYKDAAALTWKSWDEVVKKVCFMLG